MIVDGKVRKMKFSERVRENFERFKDRIEGLGRKALIGGILIGGSVGCASNNYYMPPDPYDLYYKASLLAKADSIYAGCLTKEDSIQAANKAWVKETGSNDPEVWWKIYNGQKTTEQAMRMHVLWQVTSQYLPKPLYAPFIYFQYVLDESKELRQYLLNESKK